MPTPEGHSPKPDELRNAEAAMTDRQRELTETRGDALFEGRKEGVEKDGPTYPETIQEAITLGRTKSGKAWIHGNEPVGLFGSREEDPNEFTRISLDAGAEGAVRDMVKYGEPITIVEDAQGESIGVLLNDKLIYEKSE